MSSQPEGRLVLVDSSAWIGFFAKTGYGHLKQLIGSLLDLDQVATAGPIALELIQGCRSEKERVQLMGHLQALCWLTTKDEHWYGAGELAFTLRRVGITVSAVDALIASLAEAYDCTLLHQDSDFERIARHSPLRTLT
jgi:predicted nucleic acid-binding protein